MWKKANLSHEVPMSSKTQWPKDTKIKDYTIHAHKMLKEDQHHLEILNVAYCFSIKAIRDKEKFWKKISSSSRVCLQIWVGGNSQEVRDDKT